MTNTTEAGTSRRRSTVLRFLLHYFEMVVAMVVGMLVFEPVWDTAASIAGPGAVALLDRVDAGAFVMATNMTLGMAIWMRVRGHGWNAVAEMGAAMYVPYLLLLVPYWFGWLPGEAVMMGGHILMLPAMLVAMLLRLEEYTGHHHAAERKPSTGFLAAMARRWPTWLALVVTIDNWVDPMVPPAIAMLLLPSAYLLFGVARKAFRDRRMLVLQIIGLLGYVALIVAALSVQPDVARYLIAAGWLAHAAWDGWHFVVNKVVPRAWSEWCGVVDLVIGLTIIFFL